MVGVTDIFAEITEAVGRKLGMNINFQFGDWSYIAGVLKEYSMSAETAQGKYPLICLLSPFSEERDLPTEKAKASLDFLIAVDTIESYDNPQRLESSFKAVLRPIYEEFIVQIAKNKKLDPGYKPSVPHQYIENYRYGKIGVLGPDGKPFADRIDAIDIKNLSILIKKQK